MPITPILQPMFTQTSNVTNNLALSLLTHYSFDLGGYNSSELVKYWEKQYPSNWVHLAIIEALYQGRYKAVSVQQILTLWLRRNHPSYHFNLEFERLICNKLPEDLKWNNSLPPALPPVKSGSTIQEAMRNYRTSQTVSSSVERNIEKEQNIKAIAELKSIKAQQKPKALPPSSEMVFASSETPTTINRSPASQTLIETREIEVADSKFMVEEKSETPLISKTLAKLLPPARNHPPIEQFTPEKNDTSETFTSKLKAIVTPE